MKEFCEVCNTHNIHKTKVYLSKSQKVQLELVAAEANYHINASTKNIYFTLEIIMVVCQKAENQSTS